MKRAATVLFLLLTATALAPPAMAEPVFLDPNNPLANFVRSGNQGFTPGAALLLVDSNPNDYVGFYSASSIAAAGREVEVTARFRLQSADLMDGGIDTGMRLVISDGEVTSLVVGSVQIGVPGIAIALGQNFGGAENWASFVPVDWLNEVTVRVRRHADGSGEIVEVNGAAPLGSTLVPAASLPGPFSAVPAVGFGLFSGPAFTTAEVYEFSAITLVPEPETCTLMLAGLGSLAVTARRRKQKAAARA